MRPWADPRLLCGVLLVVAATVMGGRLAATSDDVAQYWALNQEVTAGERVSADQLRPVRVDVAEGTAEHLVDVGHRFERALADSVWARDGSAGELLTHDALAAANKVSVRELPVRVEAGAAPADLARGDRVDVWASAERGSDQPSASLVLRGAGVRTVQDESALGTTERTVVLALDADALTPDVIASVGHARITLVRVP